MRLCIGFAVFTIMLEQAKQQPGHYSLSDGQKIWWHRFPCPAIIYTVIATESLCPHHRRITTITGSARLGEKHIEVMVGVVALLKAVPTYGHAGRDATSSTAVRHHMRHPNQSALGMIIVCPH